MVLCFTQLVRIDALIHIEAFVFNFTESEYYRDSTS